MNSNILPAIALFENVREDEAIRLANEIYISGDADIVAAIARYGEFIDNKQEPPHVALVDFYRAIIPQAAYQQVVLPLRGLDARLDHFDNTFAQEIFRLKQAEE